jgi:hypothetical protein
VSRGVYRDAWGLYKSRWLEVVRMAAVAYAGLALIVALLTGLIGWFVVFVVVFLALTAIFWVEAPLAKLVVDLREGRPRTPVRETFRELGSSVNRISLAGLLAGIGIYLGLYLLVIPGLLLLTRWSMLVPVIVLEGTPLFGAFSRSRELVRDHRWRVFWEIFRRAILLAASWIAALILTGIITAAAGISHDLAEAAVGAVVVVIVLSLTTPLICVAWTLRYLELAEARPPEAIGPSRLRVADALDEATALYALRAAPLLALGALVAVPIMLARYGAGWAGDWAFVLQVAATLVGYIWLQGLIAAGLDDAEGGSGRRWLAAIGARVRPRMFALAVAGLVAGLVFATGIGIVLLIWWSALGPAVVVERKGVIASFRRSRQLVRGKVRRVVGVLVLSLVLAAMVAVLIAGFLFLPSETWSYAVGFVATAVTAPWVALAWAFMYRQLRSLDEPTPAPEPEPVAAA